MRAVVLVAATALLAVSCSSSSAPVASTTRTNLPTCSVASSYGLLMSSGTLEIVSTCGTIVASAPVAAPTVQFCGASTPGPAGPTGAGAVLQPPVSATNDKVFFRDGDTKIRYVTPDGHRGDATTVPGGPNIVSFFSVSPDDQRIAVVVVDLSGVNTGSGQISADTIKLRLYVEDLQGGAHHADIYSVAWTNKQGGINTLWPMGWHSGQLVLALMRACSFEAVPPPTEWHVADAATANRSATIPGRDNNCVNSYWPSPAGVVCVDFTKPEARVYDWTGKVTATVPTESFGLQSALSPSGRLLALANGGGIGNPAPVTRIASVAGGPAVTVAGYMACLWIDESTWMDPTAVVAFPSGVARVLPAAGQCAGRFPGGL